MGLFYGETNIKEGTNQFLKIANLLLIPMMVPFFQNEKIRNTSVNLFLLAMSVTLFLSYLIWAGWLPANHFIKGNQNDPTVFLLRISHNFFMAFAAFLFAVRARESSNGAIRVLFIVLTILATFNVTVMVSGKTGYVVLIVLTLYCCLRWLKWKGFPAAVVVIAAFGILTYMSPSSGMHQRVKEFFVDISGENILHSQNFNETSSNLRIMYYKNTIKIISEHPIFGVGTGGYPRAYAQIVEGTNMPGTDNPHNEYLMVTSQLGLLGLCAFLTLFFVQWRSASDLSSNFDKMMAHGLILTILSASMVTSTLIDHHERIFYIWMSALLFGGYTSRSRKRLEEKKERGSFT